MISRREHRLNYAVLTAFALLSILPLLGVVSAALTPPGEAVRGFGVPTEGISLGNFTRVWRDAQFGGALWTSLQMTMITVVLSSVTSVLAAYAFGTMRFRGSTVLFYVFLVGLLMPFEATVIPVYYMMRGLDLTGTVWSVALPSTSLSIAFGTFWMRAFFRSAPRPLIEAARVDGASSLTILRKILLPLARPAVLTMILLIFMWTWNDFLYSLVMRLQTAPLTLAQFQGYRRADVSGIAAAAILVALPVLIAYIALQRHFIRGMLAGSMKG
jgi:raffinose/stachyose/melibiose transport system permease protein